MNNFTKRAITGVIFVAVLVAAILAGPWSFSLLFLLVSVLALSEFYQLVRLTDHRPQYLFGLSAGMVIYVIISLTGLGILSHRWLFVLLPVAAISLFLELFRKTHQPSGNTALTLFGILYIPVAFGLLSWIATYSNYHGITFYRGEAVLGLFILIWTSDTGAYLSGKAFGKTKLFERISPGKTWEGVAGGTLLTLSIAWLLSRYDLDPEISTGQWIGLAVIVQLAGTLGDLAESMIKRSIDVKDSGNTLPGHGGLLDRFDAALGVIPFSCAFLYLSS